MASESGRSYNLMKQPITSEVDGLFIQIRLSEISLKMTNIICVIEDDSYLTLSFVMLGSDFLISLFSHLITIALPGTPIEGIP